MPIVATAVPKIPPTLRPSADRRLAWSPSQWLTKSAMLIVIAVTAVVSKPIAVPAMMFVAGPVLDASAISRTGRIAAGRVVLGDVDERHAGGEADDAGGEEVDPGREAADADAAIGLHHHVGRDRETDHGQQGRDPVAAVQHVHRVFVFLAADEEDGHDRGQEAEGADDEREEDPRLGVRPAGRQGDGVDADAQDHRADVLGGGGLEEVRAAAGAVADVVADEVRDDARVAGVVLGDALLDLADEVRPDVGGLGVDAAAELGEERDERRAEAEADDEERGLGDRDVADERRVEREDAPHAEEREGDDEEAGDGPAAHRDLDRLDEAAPGRRRGPDVRLDADEHADDPEAIEHAAPTMNAMPVMIPMGAPASDWTSATSLVSIERDQDRDEDRADEGQDADGRVLAPDERHRAFEDGAGDGLHLGRAGVAAEDVAGEVDGEEHGDQPCGQDDQLERTGIHQVRGSSRSG